MPGARLALAMEDTKHHHEKDSDPELAYENEHDVQVGENGTLARELKGRHMQMIAIGT